MRKTKLEDMNLPVAAVKLIKDVEKTRNPAALTCFVKAAIARRDSLRDGSEPEVECNLDKISEKRSRDRARNMVKAILSMSDRKAVSVLCAAAIAARKVGRSKAK